MENAENDNIFKFKVENLENAENDNIFRFKVENAENDNIFKFKVENVENDNIFKFKVKNVGKLGVITFSKSKSLETPWHHHVTTMASSRTFASCAHFAKCIVAFAILSESPDGLNVNRMA